MRYESPSAWQGAGPRSVLHFWGETMVRDSGVVSGKRSRPQQAYIETTMHLETTVHTPASERRDAGRCGGDPCWKSLHSRRGGRRRTRVQIVLSTIVGICSRGTPRKYKRTLLAPPYCGRRMNLTYSRWSRSSSRGTHKLTGRPTRLPGTWLLGFRSRRLSPRLLDTDIVISTAPLRSVSSSMLAVDSNVPPGFNCVEDAGFTEFVTSMVCLILHRFKKMTSDKPSGSGSIPRGLLGISGTPVGKDTRLSSLRGKRDLTLGGVKKKTFQPNIPVRREKSKDENKEFKSGSDQPGPSARHESNRGREFRGRGRGRGRSHGEVMQSHSIFEEGPSDAMKNKSYKELADRGYSSGSRNTSGMKNEKMSHDTDTKKVLDHLLRDNFVVNDKLDCEDPSMYPVQLPVTNPVKAETKSEVKDSSVDTSSVDFAVKQEPKDEDDVMIDESRSTEKPEFLFIQLPDTLPGEPYSDDPHPSSSKKQESEIRKRQEKCTLSDFHEGLIGKLRIHKSGRTTLKLGNTILEVHLGTPPGFLQDVVSLRVNDTDGDLTVLGHVPHKVLCIPDFEAMVSES
ncbi:hypothetical protein LSH36_120g15049 [Paralvinella palmiformis]|uniref:DNA-directed RNA polymerase III subunit RPC4 n=1 Tax=Paralvinella palmiformis TaxID=53620 RepID=A0AAD9JYT8_9ANNE|nr:hypothetical protein LSH36_120g15049 [Paralvinella palmiformis]